MAEPFLGELRMFAINYAPKNWALCNGQLMPINQNQALFSLLGTTYGGNGTVDFALPDLRGRAPMHFINSAHTLGERGGEQAHTLSISELPQHVHPVNVTTGIADEQYPLATTYWAAGSAFAGFHQTPNDAMDPTLITPVGGSQAHINMQPFLVITFCIALIGIFPSRN